MCLRHHVSLTGSWKAGESYIISVDAGVKDIYGQTSVTSHIESITFDNKPSAMKLFEGEHAAPQRVCTRICV